MSAQLRLSDENLPDYLRRTGLLPEGEEVVVSAVGDGNINWVRRVRGPSGSRVVKQARLALERFPEYRTSTRRILFEARFYEVVAPLDRSGVCPRVLRFDASQRVLVLEDLGDIPRLDAELARGADASDAAQALASFLGTVHAATRESDLAARFRNDEMRCLHGDHIFVLPFRDNDFPLSPRLAARAAELRADRELMATIDAAHARYLGCAAALIHGDVQPTNVLLSPAGPRLLDAEIAHVGDPAFDLGQLLGHLLLPAAARGEPAAAGPALRAAWSGYGAAAETPARDEVTRYAAIELLRRTLGAARVPAVASDEASLAVVDTGLRLLRRGLGLEAPG